MLTVLPTAAMSKVVVGVGGMPWRNSVTCTVRSSRQRWCYQRVGCLQ